MGWKKIKKSEVALLLLLYNTILKQVALLGGRARVVRG